MTEQNSQTQIPSELLLSLATSPILLGILSLRTVSSWVQAAGIASEEVFRGDRLPILPFPELPDSDAR